MTDEPSTLLHKLYEPIIGIDLGTTHSCVATYKNNRIEIIPNDCGSRIIPSIVCIKENEELIGESAKNIKFKDYPSLMKNSKRLIGRLYNEKNILNDIKYFNSKIIKDDKTGKPQYYFKIGNEEKKYYPEEVSSMLLKHIKKYSGDYLGKEVKKAVITVPAHFNNEQREATKKAAENAGLEVIRIINEPTAAAIAYGYENQSDEERKVLIFDLGGGTFDVSIVNIKGNEFTVLSSCGNDHLGGEDFTNELTKKLLQLFIEQYPKFKNRDFYNKENAKEYKTFTRLKEEAEKIKKILSNSKNANIELDGLCGEDFEKEIIQSDFEDLCSPLWDQCIEYIKKALNEAKINKKDLDAIVLVGGSSRIPKIQEMVEKFIKDNNKKKNENSEDEKTKILKSINADEAIAMGAAIVACIETDITKFGLPNLKINDITSKSIGIGTDEGKMEILIPKGTILPVREKPFLVAKYFAPQKDFASGVRIKIFESEDNNVNIENLLKEFPLNNLPIDVKENVVIKILMYLDHNGIIKVNAKLNDVLMKECNIRSSITLK